MTYIHQTGNKQAKTKKQSIKRNVFQKPISNSIIQITIIHAQININYTIKTLTPRITSIKKFITQNNAKKCLDKNKCTPHSNYRIITHYSSKYQDLMAQKMDKEENKEYIQKKNHHRTWICIYQTHTQKKHIKQQNTRKKPNRTKPHRNIQKYKKNTQPHQKQKHNHQQTQKRKNKNYKPKKNIKKLKQKKHTPQKTTKIIISHSLL